MGLKALIRVNKRPSKMDEFCIKCAYLLTSRILESRLTRVSRQIRSRSAGRSPKDPQCPSQAGYCACFNCEWNYNKFQVTIRQKFSTDERKCKQIYRKEGDLWIRFIELGMQFFT
jgi:hypothetical protein